MKVTNTGIDGLVIIEPMVFTDERGYFFESYSKKKFESLGLHMDFVQDNQSLSQAGTVRGLHFQAPPFAQGKLVSVVKGAVLDVVVDIRKKSSTYGKVFSIELTGLNKKMLWIPEGFAHGFSTLEQDTIFHYKCTNYYDKASESGLIWNDKTLAIDWKVREPIVSEKDKMLPEFNNLTSPF